MTNLELVKHEQIIDMNGQSIRRTVVAVSSSYSALVEHCKEMYNTDVSKPFCGKPRYYTVLHSNITIIPSKI